MAIANGPVGVRRPGSRGDAVTVAVIADMNGAYGATIYSDIVATARDHIVSRAPSVVLTTGDMISAQRADIHNQGAMWEAFDVHLWRHFAAAGVPFAPSPGNHDASGYAEWSADRAAYQAYWGRRAPRAPGIRFVADADYPWHYAFSLGGVLFVSLNSTEVGGLEPAQRTWLDETLAAHGPSHQASVVYGHLPLRPVSQIKGGEALNDLPLEHVLARRNVTLVLTGHAHAYYPARRGAVRAVCVPPLTDDTRPMLDGTMPRSGFLLLRITQGSIVELEAYESARPTVRIERTGLPPTLGVPPNAYTRDDL